MIFSSQYLFNEIPFLYGLNRFLPKEIRSRKWLISEDLDKLVLKNQFSPSIQEAGLWSTLIKKKIKSSSYIRKFREVAKSYLRKGFLILEEMRKYFRIYEEALQVLHFLFPHIWEKIDFRFHQYRDARKNDSRKKVKNAAKVQ